MIKRVVLLACLLWGTDSLAQSHSQMEDLPEYAILQRVPLSCKTYLAQEIGGWPHFLKSSGGNCVAETFPWPRRNARELHYALQSENFIIVFYGHGTRGVHHDVLVFERSAHGKIEAVRSYFGIAEEVRNPAQLWEWFQRESETPIAWDAFMHWE